MKPNTIKTNQRIFEVTNSEGEIFLCNLEHFKLNLKGSLVDYDMNEIVRVRHYWNNSLLKLGKIHVKEMILAQKKNNQNNLIMNTDNTIKNRTVWVGGIEVNDYYLTKNEAQQLANEYKAKGYDDVQIETVRTIRY